MTSKESTKIDDAYTRVTDAIDRSLRNKTAPDLYTSNPEPFWKKWRWSLIIAPLLSSILVSIIGIYILIFINSALYLHLIFIAGQLLTAILSTWKVTNNTFEQRQSRILYRIGISIFVIIAYIPGSVSNAFIMLANQASIIGGVFFATVTIISSFLVGLSTTITSRTIQSIKLTFGDFISTYRSTIGYSENKVVMTALRLVLQISQNGDNEKELEYLRASAQAMIDSSSTRILPWVILLTSLSFGFDNLFKNIFDENTYGPILWLLGITIPSAQIGIALGILYIAFNVAHRTYIDVAILQAIVKTQQRHRSFDKSKQDT
jgi:hypothetical protein